ncbi:hypothetical protein OSB04_031404 [Centaurea solstitialis]|uniref:DUF4218 domain-containing protein n=1 Tax=Centaurea solstitialis TaxID=347529 RepID=A0AA38W832_9ASTR|nr:hypothetical protein OSB04_031404 [Centaurea solstitialis]
MRWHKEKRVNDDNIVRHSADSEAWKHLDKVFPSFPKDPCNVRLGLATDGFNPFGNLSSSYSMWRVFVVPYNLPPWKCMKDPYMFMLLLIPCPKSPGINIDVYLQPLIDELNELWVGVTTYDADRKETFSLRAALLCEPYGFTNTKKRKYLEEKPRWKKKSSFFRIPYWAQLKVRHNIDITHVVKNVSESLVATLFNIKGKTKDTWKSHKDLMDQGLKKSVHLQPHGNSFVMPMACYHLTKDKKEKILDLLKYVKFPDGFASNISRCVRWGEFQLSCMKSHDFYVFIQRVLPLSIRGCLTKEVRLVLYELSEFIQKLCTRNVYLDVVEKQEAEIVIILCKLERLYPPSFFDIMTHLLILSPYEAKIAARPEGCIAERYIDNECLNFCSMYLNDVDTVFNKVERNNEMMESGGENFVFSCKGRPLGSQRICAMSETELRKIHTYILNNCHELEELINKHKIELERESYNDVNERHDKQFASWLGLRVNNCQQPFASEIRILSRGPLSFVNQFSGCMVNGYMFHTQSREKDRKTQNSGVVVRGDHGENVIDFYGILEEVLEVEYLGENKRVLVFKCDWFRVGDARGNVPLELVDDSLVIDERFIDDDEIDPTDSEFSQKEDSWEDSTDSN